MKNNKPEVEIFLTTIQRVFSLVPGLPEYSIIHLDDTIDVIYKIDDPTIRGPLAISLMGMRSSVNKLNRNTDDFSRLSILLHFCTNSLPVPEVVSIEYYSTGYYMTSDGIMHESLEYDDPDDESLEYRIEVSLSVFIEDRVVEKLEYLNQLSNDGIQLLLKNEYGIETTRGGTS